MFFFQIKCAPFFLGIAEWVTVITRTIYVCLRKLCLLATECKIWALRNLLGIHKAPLKLVILELGCCFTAPVSITFTHSVISTTVIATLAAGNVIQLDLMAAALTLAGPLAVLQLFDELAKRDLLEKVKSGWDTLQVFSLFSFSLYTLHIHKGLLLCFQKSLWNFLAYFVSLPLFLLSLTGFFANFNEGNSVFSNDTYHPHDILDTHLGFLQGNHLSCVLGKFLITQLLRELGGCCELGTVFDCMWKNLCTDAEQETGAYLSRISVHATLATLQVGGFATSDVFCLFRPHEQLNDNTLTPNKFFFSCNHQLQLK